MRRLERQIVCEDHSGRRYRIEVFVTTEPMMTPYGVWDVDGPEECWLDTGNSYRPVNVVEPFDVFTFVDQGQLLTLRRVPEGGRLRSLFRGPTYAAP